LNSIKNLEETIEAAKAMLSEEKTPVTEERVQDVLTESENLIKTSNTLISSEQGFKPKIVDTSSHKDATRRSRKPYYLFSAAFCIWVILLLAIYLPISGLVAPIFPLTISDNMMMSFFVSSTVASIIPLFIGINKLRGKE
jgi:hypothetical protein